jgi:hypothetical protein
MVRLLVVAIIAIPVAIAVFNSSSSKITPVPMPNPNGYDGIVHAGIAVSSNFWAYKKMGTDQLRLALKTNATPIAKGHEALKLQCRMPPWWIPGSNSVAEKMAPIDLSDAFAAEGQLAALENRPQDAMKAYLDMVRLGNQSPQGGSVSDGLIGIRIESRGVDLLQIISTNLDGKTCAEIAKQLERLDSQRPSMATYVKQERNWERQNFPGLKNGLVIYYMHLPFTYEGRVRRKAAQTYAKQAEEIRNKMVEIAARAYLLEKGHRPNNVENLVPAYLSVVPQDPVSGKDMTLTH